MSEDDEEVEPAWYIVLDIISNPITDGPLWQRVLFSVLLAWMIVELVTAVIA